MRWLLRRAARAREIRRPFVEGAKDLAAAALLVAFSRAILVVAENGKIIDSMLHSLAGGLEDLSPTVTAELMYLAHTAINFFVPSGSGQAALTMPLMTPLADLTGVPRETANRRSRSATGSPTSNQTSECDRVSDGAAELGTG